MPEEKRHYRGRRQALRRQPEKKHIYFKKLAKQTIVSAAILGVFVAGNSSSLPIFTQIQNIARSAITYKLDTTHISKVLNKIFEFAQKPRLKSTEENINENNNDTKETV